ncbi:MAG: hypothetical protein VKL59_12005 [Nostocaceae cyanobacterium]|nr:hypothetical protein [Nostocaceae cyanobacterium]
MLAVICLINTLISLILLYLAWRLYHVRQVLAQLADNLSAWEHSTHEVLQVAPENILLGRQSIYQLRQKNRQPPSPQTQILQQIVPILRLGWKIRRQFKKGLMTND